MRQKQNKNSLNATNQISHGQLIKESDKDIGFRQ